MIGIADVARLAGVSKATASRALSGRGHVSAGTRDRVTAAAASLEYVPSTHAVSLATGRTRNVGVVVPHIDRWFFAQVLEGVQDALLERGLDLTLYDAAPGTAGRRRVFDDLVSRRRFDGLITVGLEADDAEIERLVSLQRPIVSVVGDHPGRAVVAVDDTDAARRATEHLLALGHRAIAFLGGGAGRHWAQVDRARLSGYLSCLDEAGLSAEAVHVPAEVTLPGGYAAAADLLGNRRRRPTAIVATCDEVAIGAIIAARRLAVAVPSDLSVVGIDDHTYAEMFSLTTLAQVPRDQGRMAVEILTDAIADSTRAPTQIRLQARMIVRNSTAPPDGATSVIAADRSRGVAAG